MSVTKYTSRAGRPGWRIQVYLGRRPDGGQIIRTRVVYPAAGHTKAGRADAQRSKARFLLELDKAAPSDIDNLTLSHLFDEWLAVRGPGWSPKTVEATLMWRRKIETWFGDPRIADITSRQVDRFYAHLAAAGSATGGPLQGSSVQRCHDILAALFRQAVRWDWLARSPVDNAERPRRAETTTVAPTPEAVAAALDHAAATSPLWYAYLRLAATTGARRGELLGLRWSDLGDDGALSIRRSVGAAMGTTYVKSTKTGRSRKVYLSPADLETVAALRAHADEYAELAGGVLPADCWLFTTGDDPETPLHPDSVKNWWARLKRDIPALEGVRFHDLRHFVGTQLIDQGHSPTAVAEHLGHSTSTTTLRIYAHPLEASGRRAGAAMSDTVDRARRLA